MINSLAMLFLAKRNGCVAGIRVVVEGNEVTSGCWLLSLVISEMMLTQISLLPFRYVYLYRPIGGSVRPSVCPSVHPSGCPSIHPSGLFHLKRTSQYHRRHHFHRGQICAAVITIAVTIAISTTISIAETSIALLSASFYHHCHIQNYFHC